MRMSRTPVAAVAAVLVLAGCGGGDGEASDPEPIIPSSSSADPSPSEPSESEDTGEAPEMPEAAKERSAEGVEAFLGYWAASLTYALNTGDDSPLRQIFGPDCESCEGTYDYLDEVYGDGGSIRNDGWQVRQVVIGEFLERPLAKFDRGFEVVRRSGQDPERYPAAISTIEFDLGRAGGSWVVNEFSSRSS